MIQIKFTYESYIELLKRLKESTYRITTFLREEDTPSPQVILRHDVDVSPTKAFRMAEVEEKLRVNSTYFFMISSEWYNLMDKENENALLAIRDMGHEIGLHFDVSNYPISNLEELESILLRQLNILGSIISCPVKAVSWHIPSDIILGKNISFLDDRWIKNAYDSKYFNNYKYLSDSNMNWREDPFAYIDSDRFPKIQLLTHPIWYREEEMPKMAILNVELGKKTLSAIRYLEEISPGFVEIDANHV